MKRLIVVAILGLGIACAKGGSSPSAPTPTPVPPAPAPTPTYTVDGFVRESAPTASTGVGGATVRVEYPDALGGQLHADAGKHNAVQTVTTAGDGYYLLSGVRGGNATFTITKPGYVDQSKAVSITSSGPQHFSLLPVFAMLSNTYTDSVNGGSPVCPDFYSTSRLPCVQYSVPAHYSGRLTAVLTWTDPQYGWNDLNLALMKSPRENPEDRIAISRSVSGNREEVSADLTAGVQYYIHVLYYDGGTVQPFTLVLTRPN